MAELQTAVAADQSSPAAGHTGTTPDAGMKNPAKITAHGVNVFYGEAHAIKDASLDFEEILLNAGVVLSSIGDATYLVLLGLLVGKPLGVWGFGVISTKVFGFQMPHGIRQADLVVIGFAAGIGFTVSLFIATVAFDPGPIQDAAKMGALASFLGAALAWLAGRVMRVEKVPPGPGGSAAVGEPS